MSRGRFVVVLLTLLAAIPPLSAQSGLVRVKITDPLGARIADAEVSFLGKDKAVIQKARSDRAGELILSGLPIGDGSLIVNIPGFKPMTFLMNLGNKDESIDARLQQGKIHVDYDGRQPSPIKRVRVRVTDSAGVPITRSHGWVVSDDERPVVTADDRGELLFTSVPLYPGILIAADGYSSKLVQLMPGKGAEVRVDVVLR